MNRPGWMTCAILAAGCQAPPQPVVVAPVPVAPVPVAPVPVTPPADPRAAAAAKLAEAQAKSIDAMLIARAAGDAGVPVIEPAKKEPPAPAPAAAPTAAAPKKEATPQPPGVAAVAAAIAGTGGSPADGLRPVPPLDLQHPPTAVEPMAVEPAAGGGGAGSLAGASGGVAGGAAAEPPRSLGATDAGSTDPLDADLNKKAREYPRDLAPQLDAQLLHFLHDEKVPTADAMAGLNMEDRDVLTSVLDGLTNFRNGIRADNNLLITRKIRPLVEMADRLRSRADLAIVDVMLCRSIKGYGVYEPLASPKLVAGVNSRPKLYYEIENVTPRLDGNNLWTTVMRQDLVLYDDAGRPVWNAANVPVTDVCRNRRRDFFFAYILDLPTTLGPGRYTLKITLSDALAGRVSESSLPIGVTNVKGDAPGPSVAPPAGPPLPRDGDTK